MFFWLFYVCLSVFVQSIVHEDISKLTHYALTGTLNLLGLLTHAL